MTRRGPGRRARIAIAAVVALAVGACGSGKSNTSAAQSPKATTAGNGADPGPPVTGGTITVALEAETNGWLPGTANFSNAGINVALAIYDPLLRRDAGGAPHPYLAERLEHDDALTTWTLTLRPNVQFQDGTPLNAQAIKTDFDTYIKAPKSNLAGQVSDVASVDVTGDLTVVYRLKEANAAFADVLTGAVGWPFSPTAAAKYGADAGAHPVGTGPFVFKDWQRDSRLVVDRNPNYWQKGLPYLDEIVFRPIPDEDTRLASLVSGDVDVVQSLRQSTIRQLRDVKGAHSYEALGNNSGAAIFNTAKPPLDDVRVRQALAYALDQDQLIQVLGGKGLTPPETQYFSKDSPYYSAKAAAAWPTNKPDEAVRLITAYKNDPHRSDGQPVGAPVKIKFDCPPDPSLNELSQLYQALWNAAGVEVDLNQVEQATHVSQALAGNFQAKCWRVGDQTDPYLVLSDAFTKGNPLNFTRFTDPRIDTNLQTLRTTTDIAKRKAAVEAISMVLDEEVPNTFTAGTLTTLTAKDAVKNIDGWTFPDGAKGEGVPGATTQWGNVWRAR